MAADQDLSVYMTKNESNKNTHWRIIDIGNNEVWLQNEGTTFFLHNPGKNYGRGNDITTWDTGLGNGWKIFPVGMNSDQIYLESVMGGFLYRDFGVILSDKDDSGRNWIVKVIKSK